MTLLNHRFPIESAAEFLRAQAMSGINRADGQASIAYIARCSILHTPTNTCVVFTRDDVDGRMKCWHLAVFRKRDGALVQMEENLPKQWALAVFGSRQMKHVRRVSTRGSQDPRPEAQRHLETSWHYVIQVQGWPAGEKEPLIVVPGDEKAGSVLPERTIKE